jgi:plastocyanin
MSAVMRIVQLLVSGRPRVLAALVLGSLATVPATAPGAEIPSIAAFNEPGIYSYHRWSPSTATVLPEGVVKFSNPYTTTYHGLKFTGGPAGATPNCTGIPQMATEPIGAFHWEGECTFTKPGTYTFVCTVHPVEMTGTITVTNGEPTVVTQAASSVAEHEATLNGTVNPNGKATEYFFEWGPTEAYGEKTNPVSAGAGTVDAPATATLTGLTPATPYHFRLVATNEKGTVDGPDQTFTTASPPGPPSVSTEGAGAVGETGATIKGSVNPDGRPTEYFFEWGTTEAYGQATAKVTVGQDHLAHSASATLSVLSPATTYHYRLSATNTLAETVHGADQTFTTLTPPPSPPPSPPPTTPTTPTAPTLMPTTPLIVDEPPPGPALVTGSLKLTVPRRGTVLRTALEVTPTGAGGSLEADIFIKGSLLGRTRGTKSVRIVRVLRRSVAPGRLSLSLPLSGPAKRALARRHTLPLTVRITLKPPTGHAETIARTLTLRA